MVTVLLFASPAAAHDLGDLEDILSRPLPTIECPAPPTVHQKRGAICGDLDGEVIFPFKSVNPFMSFMRLECGEYQDGNTIKGCGIVTYGVSQPEGPEDIQTIIHPMGVDECLPVPEPGVGVGLAVGSLAIVIIRRRTPSRFELHGLT